MRPKIKKSPETALGILKDWRLPTLAEAIQPLPSAMQRLTAVFGMGTGRTTAVMPPNYCARFLTCKISFYKDRSEVFRRFSENYTQEPIGVSTIRELKFAFP